MPTLSGFWVEMRIRTVKARRDDPGVLFDYKTRVNFRSNLAKNHESLGDGVREIVLFDLGDDAFGESPILRNEQQA